MFEMSSPQLVSFGLIAAAAVLFMILERIFAYNQGRPLLRPDFWLDMVWYNFIQSAVLGWLIAEFIRWIDHSTEISRLRIVSDWPVWVQLGFFLVTHDLYIYCFHRLQHKVGWLWRIHEAHHATDDVDWLSGVRSHPLEILINQTIEFLPIVLLGAAPEVAIYKGTISAIWGMYIHSNLDVHAGFFQYVFNGPEMHRWHHDRSERAHNKNFGTKLAIWDWMLGTAFMPPGEKASTYGIEDRGFPKGYFSQIAYAFREEEKNALALSHDLERV